MFFSVIIPTYHRNDLLEVCLQKLVPQVQKLPQELYEVIITDDGRTSTAAGLVEQKFPWARWVKGLQKGPAVNRNNGAANAKGDWLVFVDDDCIPDEDLLISYKRSIESNPAVRAFEGKIICSNEINSPLEHSPVNITGGNFYSCNICIKSDLFKTLKGFNEKLPNANMEDFEIRDRILESGETIYFAADAIVDHPPRRMPDGKKLAKSQESLFLYLLNRKEKNIYWKMVYSIGSVRLYYIVKRKKNQDTFLALWSFMVEMGYMAFYYNTWKRKYSSNE